MPKASGNKVKFGIKNTKTDLADIIKNIGCAKTNITVNKEKFLRNLIICPKLKNRFSSRVASPITIREDKQTKPIMPAHLPKSYNNCDN